MAEAAKNPSLLITNAPPVITTGQGLKIKISTRNLVRDRFLAAGDGGYYLETSILTADDLQRGHFHVACRYLDNDREAPPSDPVPAFFKAIEDGKGGSAPDTVVVEVPAKTNNVATFPRRGELQCSAWAGDGSHRIPMMQRANQTPAFDSVRVRVIGRNLVDKILGR